MSVCENREEYDSDSEPGCMNFTKGYMEIMGGVHEMNSVDA